MNILISGCLLGLKCRYDAKEKKLPEIEKLIESYNLIPVSYTHLDVYKRQNKGNIIIANS